MSEHTPVPWWAANGKVWTDSGGLAAHMIAACILSEKRPNNAEANSQFIVRACNSYNDLLTALEATEPILVELACAVASEWGRDLAADDKAIINQVRAAIAKAKGDTT